MKKITSKDYKIVPWWLHLIGVFVLLLIFGIYNTIGISLGLFGLKLGAIPLIFLIGFSLYEGSKQYIKDKKHLKSTYLGYSVGIFIPMLIVLNIIYSFI
jgi:hypothetical protein